MMDRELLVRQSQAERGDVTNGTNLQNSTSSSSPSSSSSSSSTTSAQPPTLPTTTPANTNATKKQNTNTPTTPSPPRLTPNPTMLFVDSTAVPVPTTSSPPPPLTPAPSVSTMSHGNNKITTATASSTSPHILVPPPPKLTSTAIPALRTYSRPILPLPMKSPTNTGLSKTTTPKTQASSTSCNSSSSSSTTTSNVVVASGIAAMATTKTSSLSTTGLTNGNATRPVSTATSTPITPFHTPASPPGRQVSTSHPLIGSAGLVRANRSAVPVRNRVSQQTLLLGNGLKGSGQDQVLLRAQMLILTSAMRPALSSSSPNPASAQLQSLTLRPPGALTIPPSLRLKPPLFPPLRPRPQNVTTTTDGLATPSRHLSVPPPTLYSPVRAVPLRPRLHSPNGHRATISPRQISTLQPIAAAPSPSSSQTPATQHRPLSAIKSCPLTQKSTMQTMLGPNQTQSQHSSSVSANSSPNNNPSMSIPTHHFERTPSAARQLQIIALSSGRQTQQPGTYTHTSVKPAATSEVSGHQQSKRTLSVEEDKRSIPLNLPMPKKVCLMTPVSPTSQIGTQFQTQKVGAAKKSDEIGQGIGDVGIFGTDLRVEKEDQKAKASDDKRRISTEQESVSRKEKDTLGKEEQLMEVTEQGQTERVEEKKLEEKRGDSAMDQTENRTGHILHHNTDVMSPSDTVTDLSLEPKTITGLIQDAVPEVPVQSHRLAEPLRAVPPAVQDDFCENMSTQSDNQSALSSLSSQSPPCSPFITSTPPTEQAPPLLTPNPTRPNTNPTNNLASNPTRPTDLSLPQQNHHSVYEHNTDTEVEVNESQLLTTQGAIETVQGAIDESEEGIESSDQWESRAWQQRAWPEGRQEVLTHLVEGFVIQEGLQPFPVNRSSLLVPDHVTKQELNGTNGDAAAAALPVTTDTEKQTDRTTDSEDPDNTAATEQRLLHCQFCGKRGHAHNFMRSKRFCSTSCARGFNVRLTKRLRALSAASRTERPRPPLNRAESVPGKPLLLRLPRDLWSAGRREKDGKNKVTTDEEEEEEEEESDQEVDHGMEHGMEPDDVSDDNDPAVAMTARMERRATRRARRASAPTLTNTNTTSCSTSSSSSASLSAAAATTARPSTAHWSVEQVSAFIHTLPGCGDVAEAFRVQEIDGQALLLLTEDHLMTSMNIKLGPALKICAHINTLKNQ